MDEKAQKELNLRLERIEKALEVLPRRAAAEEVSADELRAFVKVRAALGWETCGINETSPCIVVCRTTSICSVCSLCQVCRICRICDVECTCGPCNLCMQGGGGPVGGGGRFGGLGG